MAQEHNQKKISRVRLRRASDVTTNNRFFLYLEVAEGPHAGNLITMWVDSDNPQSDNRIDALAKVFNVPSRDLLDAAWKGNTQAFNNLAEIDKVFTVIWRFGDTNPRITFVDELY